MFVCNRGDTILYSWRAPANKNILPCLLNSACLLNRDMRIGFKKKLKKCFPTRSCISLKWWTSTISSQRCQHKLTKNWFLTLLTLMFSPICSRIHTLPQCHPVLQWEPLCKTKTKSKRITYQSSISSTLLHIYFPPPPSFNCSLPNYWIKKFTGKKEYSTCFPFWAIWKARAVIKTSCFF